MWVVMIIEDFEFETLTKPPMTMKLVRDEKQELPDFSVFDPKSSTKDWQLFRKVTQEDMKQANFLKSKPLSEVLKGEVRC